MKFRTGQVIVTEQNDRSFFSRMVGKLTSSRVSHVALVLDEATGVEAKFPRVRRFSLDECVWLLEKERRAWAVLECPRLTMDEALGIRRAAESYVGRWYDVGQVALFATFGRFMRDGPGTLVCSRLITAAYEEGAGIQLFPTERHVARPSLSRGYAAPVDILSSILEPVHFVASSTCSTFESLGIRGT